MCSNIGTPNNHHFPFGTNGKVVVLGVPILKHFRVIITDTAFYLASVNFHWSFKCLSRNARAGRVREQAGQSLHCLLYKISPGRKSFSEF